MDVKDKLPAKEKFTYYFIFLYFLLGTTLQMFSKQLKIKENVVLMMEPPPTKISSSGTSLNVLFESYFYEAIHHFTNINAGEVTYYKDKKRNALAINASVVTDRNKFAKATTIFSGKDGIYNVVLITLAEFDGECSYRFLINGTVKGTYQNLAVSQENDYQEQKVIFKGITINNGDEIAIESNSHTNGKIPEGTGTAWARGRWKSISFDSYF